jgi:transposase InsO family protein
MTPTSTPWLLARCELSRAACKRLSLRQIFTRPYTPKTNGKAERFIQTALREWAYAHAYQNSDQRTAELSDWLHRYNWHRPHGSMKAQHAHQSPRSIAGQPVEAPQLD